MWYLLGFLFLLISPGLYFAWEDRHHNTFKIEKNEDGFVLWFNWRGEWIEDSRHLTRQAAVDKIVFYFIKKSHRLTLRKW